MKVGLAGLGFMGGTHLAAYQKIPQVRVCAVASTDEAKLRDDFQSSAGNLDRGPETIDLSSVAKYRSFEELIADPQVEAVDLCTPSYLHADQAVAALEAGKHVLVEKPMALRFEDCERMIEAYRRSGKVLMVAQALRFLPEYAAARRLTLEGGLGRPLYAFFQRRCAAPDWNRWLPDKSKSGGGVFDLLIHDFDFCQYVFGRPNSIAGEGLEDLERGIDVLEARLKYSNGPLVTVAGGWRHPKSYPFSMEFTIVCEEGTLDFHSGVRPLTLYRLSGEAEKVEVGEKDAFVAELETFAAACEKGVPPAECLPEDSAESVRTAFLAAASRGSRDRR